MNIKRKWIIVALVVFIGAAIAYFSLPREEETKVPVIIEIPNGVETITPNTETSNIDAVSYETLMAEKITTEQILTHVFIEGLEENISRFVLPYTDFIKELNPGVTDVVIKMYRSKEDYELNNPAWQYANGIFAPISTEEQPEL